jgi:hypothetical protein
MEVFKDSCSCPERSTSGGARRFEREWRIHERGYFGRQAVAYQGDWGRYKRAGAARDIEVGGAIRSVAFAGTPWFTQTRSL